MTRAVKQNSFQFVQREVPRVLIIYDIDLEVNQAKAQIRDHFHKNGHVKDSRVINMLVEKGYMDLEETLLQYKQKAHLMKLFDGYVDDNGPNRKILPSNATPWEQFARE